MHALASSVEEVLRQAKITDYVLVGHSMGGKVGQLIAGDKKVDGLRGIILVAPAPPGPFDMPEEAKKQQKAAYQSREAATFVMSNVLTAGKLSESTVENLVCDALRGSREAKEYWPSQGMLEDVTSSAVRIDVPILVVSGEKDQVETVERAKSDVLPALKDARHEIIPGYGHLIPVEAPHALAKYIKEFVASLASSKMKG